MRLVEYLEGSTRKAARQLAALQVDGYDSDDVGLVARNVAAIWERSLKAAEANWAASDAHLFDMANDLEGRRWPAAADLHVIRRAANADKHQPGPQYDFDQLLDALTRIAGNVGSLVHLTPGLASDLPERMRRRRMVCAIYEFFAQGETQYSFLAAKFDDTWNTVREIDSFQVQSQHSGEIEGELAKFDGWVLNPPELKDLQASLEQSDHELWQVGVFTASYQEVLDLMTPYQHSLPLLGGLHREDRVQHVVATVVAAQIAGRSDAGVTTRASGRVGLIATRVDAVLSQVPGGVTGLRLDRCKRDKFELESSGALAIDDELGLLVTSTGVVYVLE